VRNPRRVLDLGCGTGALTSILHRRLGAELTLGIDSSPAMLQRALSVREPRVRIERGDIETFESGELFDLVFSNAALQWVPDHPRLLARITALVAAGGELALQVPANFDHPSHVLAAEIAREPEFAGALGGYVRETPVLAPERYAELLHRLGVAEQHVRMQVYGHVLGSAGDVVEWTRGTLLTDYAARMPDTVFVRFVDEYRRRVLDSIGDRRPYFYAFKRILMWARCPA
jgi:trans-aconitate 2-methyltransferase